MRVGDSIVIGRAEAELLESEAFAQVIPPEVASRIKLTRVQGRGEDCFELALPKVGRPVVEALHTLRVGSGREALVAEHLAEAIEQRIAFRFR